MRGRKIKIIFKDKDAEEEPELDFENDQGNAGGTGNSDIKQVVAIDGEEL